MHFDNGSNNIMFLKVICLNNILFKKKLLRTLGNIAIACKMFSKQEFVCSLESSQRLALKSNKLKYKNCVM